MSLTLYNGPAHHFDANKESWITYMMKESGFEEFDRSTRALELKHKLWNAYEEYRPADNATTGVGEGVAQWLYQATDKKFFFPEEGLRGKTKDEVVQALRVVYARLRAGQIEFEDPMLGLAASIGAAFGTLPRQSAEGILEKITRLGKFIDSNEEIFTW